MKDKDKSHVIRWQTPPRDWTDDVRDLAEELRARPGEWALVIQGESWTEEFTDRLSFVEGLEWRVDSKPYGGPSQARMANGRWRADLYVRAKESARAAQ